MSDAPIEFVDEDDDVFRAERYGTSMDVDATVEFSKFPTDGLSPVRIVFYAKDAETIIKLIREAAL